MSTFVRMSNTLRCTPDGEGTANLRGVRDADEGHKIHIPRLRWRWISAVASKEWPVGNIHPHPASLVHPFSPPGHHRFKEDWRKWGLETPPLPFARAQAQ